MMQALPEGTKMIATGVDDADILVPLKVTLMVAFMLALPYVLYQAWAFVAPGPLRAREAHAAAARGQQHAALPAGRGLLLLRRVRAWSSSVIHSYAPTSDHAGAGHRAYLNFVMTMFLAFGITFEIPVALIVLVRMGVVTSEKLKEVRSYLIVGAFVIAAVVTPPDVLSQLAAGDTDVPALRGGHSSPTRYLGKPARADEDERGTARSSGRQGSLMLASLPLRDLRPASDGHGRARRPRCSRSSLSFAWSPGFSTATRLSTVPQSPTGLPLTPTSTSPGFTPALSAGPPRTTCVMSAPSHRLSLNDLGQFPGDVACTPTPIQPRVTDPSRMICSITWRAMETGIANPIPMDRPAAIASRSRC